MKNDGTMYLRLHNNEIFYPDEVFPFEYEKIKLFACEYDGLWRATCTKTGYRIGWHGENKESVEIASKKVIDMYTVKTVKKMIKDCVDKTKEGLFYDSDTREWKQPTEIVTGCSLQS